MEHKHISYYITVYVQKNSRMCVVQDFIYTKTLKKNVAYNPVTITPVHYMIRYTNSTVRSIPNVRTRMFKTPKLPYLTLYRLEESVISKRRMFLSP